MTWVINMIVLSLICHGSFIFCIYKTMKIEEQKQAKKASE